MARRLQRRVGLEASLAESCHHVTQPWAAYTPDDHALWREIVEARLAQVERVGSRLFLEGVDALRLPTDHVADLDAVNEALVAHTGWRGVGVGGFIPAADFFSMLGRREFPVAVGMRTRAQRHYLPEPDIVHDAFGHLPLHTDPVFAGFLEQWGQVAARATAPADIERLARLFWFTVEFGLIVEGGELKLFGAGLISSDGEGRHALESPTVDRRPFDLDAVCDTPFEIDHYQPILYVMEAPDQLRCAIETFASRLDAPPQDNA